MPASWLRLALQTLLVRLRFPLLFLGVVLLVAVWPWLRNGWERLTGPAAVEASVSPDAEYWCPMCPGVVSDWPGKCPVCHMDLVRRKKGEAVPLPDGVVARMQISPYRIELAGIRTSPVQFRPLEWEATFGGLVEPADSTGRVLLPIHVPEMDIACVRVDQPAEVKCEAFAGQTFDGRVRDLAPRIDADAHTLRAVLQVENPAGELRPGLFATARPHLPLTQLEGADRLAREDWRDRTAVEAALHSLPAFVTPAPGLQSLLEASGRRTLHERGLTLAVPVSAVIDGGEGQVVFVERMPGMFDAVEVRLGRRCGDYYPVLGGLEPGQSVVTAGAFLLDAETRLSPSLAAGYFGAGSRPARTAAPPPDRSPVDDQQLIARQEVCPVTGKKLGSMGPPVRVVYEGRVAFLCCQGCKADWDADPKKYLGKLPPK
jgi:membrane fusion protein, copper/silver efflux system